MTHKQLFLWNDSLKTVMKSTYYTIDCFCAGENEMFLFHEKYHSVCARENKTWTRTHLKPLSVGLHLEDAAGVRLGQSISVRYSFTGHTELHFCQTWAVEEAQRGGSRLVDVTHFKFPRSSCEKNNNNFLVKTLKHDSRIFFLKKLILLIS